MTETVAAIVAAHRAGTLSPAQTVARTYQRIRDHNDPAIFISLRDEKLAVAEAEALTKKDAARLPLYGVPFAVKDNIDALGLPTTAACPAFSFTPAHDATAVAKLRAAGAIILAKTNMAEWPSRPTSPPAPSPASPATHMTSPVSPPARAAAPPTRTLLPCRLDIVLWQH